MGTSLDDRAAGPPEAPARGEAAGGVSGVVAGPPLSVLTVKMNVPCDHCAARVPVNGPTRSVHCAACQKANPLTRVPKELALASDGARVLGSPYNVDAWPTAEPECGACGAVVPIADVSGATAGIACAQCGAALSSFPAPAWLREQLPAIRHVFGAEPEPGATSADAGATLAVAQARVEPVAMACPRCAGGLTVTRDLARVITCPYCSVNVFLPDELWRRMHPVKLMRAWTVSYAGPPPLMTRADLREAEREAEEARAQAEEARLRAEEARARAEEERAQAVIARRNGYIWLVIMILALAGTIAYFVCVGTRPEANFF